MSGRGRRYAACLAVLWLACGQLALAGAAPAAQTSLATRATAAWFAGHLDESLALAQVCASTCTETGAADQSALLAATIDALFARFDAARERLLPLTGDGHAMSVRVVAHAQLADLALAMARHDEATARIVAGQRLASSLPASHEARLAIDTVEAGVLRDRGDTARARERYGALAAQLPAADSEAVARVLVDAGQFAIYDRRPADVGRWLTAGCAMRERLFAADHPLRLSCESVSASELFRQDRLAEAARLHASILERRRARLPEHSPDVAESLYALALVESRLPGRTGDAIAHLGSALDSWRTLFGAGHPWIAQGLRARGQWQYYAGHLDDAAASLAEALAMFEQAGLGDGSDAARILHDLASVREQQYQPAEAARLMARAAAITARIAGENSTGYATRLVRLASLAAGAADFGTALASLAEAERIYASAGLTATAPERLALLEHRLRLQLATSDASGARASAIDLRRWREAADDWQRPARRLSVLNLQALAARLDGRIVDAMALWREAAAIPATDDVALGHRRAAQLNLALADPHQASARATFDALADDPRASTLARAVALLGRSRLALASGDIAAAAADSARSLQLSALAEDPVQFAWALHQHARVLQQQGKPAPAIVLLRAAVERAQAQRAGLALQQPAIARSLLERNAVLYRDLAGALLGAGRLGEAEQVTRELRSAEQRELRTRGGGPAPAALPALPDEIAGANDLLLSAADLVALSREQAVLARRQQSATATPDELARLAAITGDIARAQRAFDDTLRRIEKIRREQRIATDTAGLAALQPSLRRTNGAAVALQYIAASDELHILMTTGEARTAFSVPVGSAEVARRVFNLREAIRQRAPGEAARAARELHDTLLPPPVRAALTASKARHLLLAPDGTLRYVPFAALRDASGRYLVEDFALSLLGAGAHATAPSAGSRHGWQVAAMGLTQAREGLEPLPAVADELDGIVREREGDDGVIDGTRLLDEHFDEAALRDALDRQVPALHLASHFVLQPLAPQQSFLVLGNGRLTLDDLVYAPLPWDFSGVQLVTLSACETALNLGVGADGIEVGGLTDLLEERGAGSVLATLWPVADASTARFMREFYLRLLADPKATRAEALRAVQLAFIRGERMAGTDDKLRGVVREDAKADARAVPAAAGWEHPYFWAPFVLSGQWR